MSLATRCTACGTIFRVVEDQLRVSEGWVRCGRCAEVFDAREQLFDIDLEAPPPWPPVPTQQGPALDLSTASEPAWPAAPAKPQIQSRIEPPVQAFAPAPQSAQMPLASPPARPAEPFQHSSFEQQQAEAAEQALARRSSHDSIVAAAMDARQEPRWIDEPSEHGADSQASADQRREFGARADAGLDGAHLISQDLSAEMAQELEQEIAREVELEMARLSARQIPEPEPAPAARHAPRTSTPQTGAAEPEEDHGFQATTLGEGGELLAEVEAEALARKAKTEGTPASSAEHTAATSSAELPEFLRPARGSRIWNQLWMRVSLGFLCGLALVALGLQATWQFRDALVARYPQLRAEMQSFCALAHCEIKPWQVLDSFSVDASALSQAGSGHHYKLALSLRNKSEFELALPWVELSLTDANGQLVSRRALAPKDFSLSQDSLAAGTELPLQTLLTTGDRAVSGYTVELFYP